MGRAKGPRSEERPCPSGSAFSAGISLGPRGAEPPPRPSESSRPRRHQPDQAPLRGSPLPSSQSPSPTFCFPQCVFGAPTSLGTTLRAAVRHCGIRSQGGQRLALSLAGRRPSPSVRRLWSPELTRCDWSWSLLRTWRWGPGRGWQEP